MHSLPGVLLSQPLLPSKAPSPRVKFPRNVKREEGKEGGGGGGGGEEKEEKEEKEEEEKQKREKKVAEEEEEKGRLSGPQAVFENKVGQLFLTLVFGGEER